MGEGQQRKLIRYGIAAVIVLVIAGVFVQREILTAGEATEFGPLGGGSAGVDNEAPDFRLTRLDGDPVKLSDFRDGNGWIIP